MEKREGGDGSMDEELAYLVLSVVEEIPAGRVATYGQLARAHRAGAERPAGGKGAVPRPGVCSFPCHRVVDHGGRIAPGWPEQARLLAPGGRPLPGAPPTWT